MDGDNLTWVHIRVASDQAYKITRAFGVREQMAKAAASAGLRSRAGSVSLPDGSEAIGDFGQLPVEFWRDSLEFVRGRPLRRNARWTGDEDWDAGIVRGCLGNDENEANDSPFEVIASGVEFCVQDLHRIYGIETAAKLAQTGLADQTDTASTKPRKRSAQWDDWIAYLAVCVAESEIFGNTRQADALKAIADRMAKDDIDEMPRTTVHSAVVQVLKLLDREAILPS